MTLRVNTCAFCGTDVKQGFEVCHRLWSYLSKACRGPVSGAVHRCVQFRDLPACSVRGQGGHSHLWVGSGTHIRFHWYRRVSKGGARRLATGSARQL